MQRTKWHIIKNVTALGPWTGIGGLTLYLGVVGTAAASEEKVALPSGLEASLLEVIVDENDVASTYRFRFVSPDFTNSESLAVVATDLEHLCATQALPTLPQEEAETSKIVISLADAPSEFGVYDPDVTQVFEAYRIENGLCIWEVF